MPEIKNGIGPDHIVREGDTVIKNGIGPDHIVESIDCGGFQYPPDLTGVDGHVVTSSSPLTWDMLPTQDADNGSLRVIDDSHPAYTMYEFDADWENKSNKKLSWLLDVLQFRGNQITNGNSAFYESPAVELTALPDLDTSNLTNMYGMFRQATIFNQDISHFDTSNVTGMANMFQHAQAFNQDISHFDVSNVTSMANMFASAASFNQDIGGWDTSNVAGMESMFYSAAAFDQDLSGWCVEKIGAKPSSFDFLAAFENQTAKQPQWGVAC